MSSFQEFSGFHEFFRLYLPPSRVWVACHSIARVSLRTRDMSSISEISGRGRSYPTDPSSRTTCSGRVPVRRRSYGPGQAAQCTSHFSRLVLAGLRGDHGSGFQGCMRWYACTKTKGMISSLGTSRATGNRGKHPGNGYGLKCSHMVLGSLQPGPWVLGGACHRSGQGPVSGMTGSRVTEVRGR